MKKRCPWCSEPVSAGALTCAACGASLGERESLGEMVIPGVTDVDPDLVEERPYPRIVTLPTAKGGAITMMGRLPGPPEPAPDPATLGEPSEAALEMREQLDREATAPDVDPPNAGSAASSDSPTAGDKGTAGPRTGPPG